MGNTLGFTQRSLCGLLVGLDGCGKTTALYTLKMSETNRAIPVIGFCVETVSFENLDFTCWDLGGQEKIRPLWRQYYQTTDIVIMMVDGCDRDKFPQARTELHRMLADIAAVGREVVLLLLVNKCDLEEVATLSEVENALGMLDQTAFTMARQKTVRSCCALTGAGLREALQWALAAIEDNQRDRPWIFFWPWHRAAVDPVTGFGLGGEGQTKIVTSFAVPLIVSNTSDIPTTISEEPPLMNVAAASVLDDRALLVAFQNCVLPLVCWTHRQRLRVVWLYLRRYGLVGLELDCGRDVLMDQNISDIADSVVLSDVEPRDIEVATVLGPLLRDWLSYKTAIGHGVYFHVTLTRFWIHMIAVATLRQWRLHPNSDFGPRSVSSAATIDATTDLLRWDTLFATAMLPEIDMACTTTDIQAPLRWHGLSFDDVYDTTVAAYVAAYGNNVVKITTATIISSEIASSMDISSSEDKHMEPIALHSGQLFRDYFEHVTMLVEPRSRHEWIKPNIHPLPTFRSQFS